MTSILFVKVTIHGNQFKCHYLRNKKTFLKFLLHFWNLHQIWNIFQQNMTLIGFVFAKLRTAKDMVREMSKNPGFRTPFDSQHAKGSKRLLKIARKHFYYNFSWLSEEKRKISLLEIFEILGLFVNTLTADDEYSLCKSENLPPQLKYNFFDKQKTFSESFVPFLKSTSNFKIFFVFCSFSISDIADCERRGNKCLESPVSEHRLKFSMLKGLTDFWNLHGNTFIIFSNHYCRSRVRKWFS